MNENQQEYKGIWKNREIRRHFDGRKMISLNEGETNLEEVKDEENVIFLKREDQNPTGSWKDRGTAFKISQLLEENVTEVVISSSGNAAISLLTYANEIKKIKVNVVVRKEISEEKRELLEVLVGNRHEIHYVDKPKRFATQLAVERNAQLLRSSTDDDFVKGYWSLGIEIYKKIKHTPKEYVIICAVSSGATLVGLVQGLQMRLNDETKLPKIVVVQTQKCHPIVNMFYDMNLQNDKTSLSEAIANQSVLRSPQILKILRETDGEAFSITDRELREAEVFMNIRGHSGISYTSLLSVAGYLRLRNSGYNNFICLLSGR